jgi:ABC-2 type transport system ATP-binding protein
MVGGEWRFELPASGPEPLLKALIDGGAGIETLSIERPGLHDAFIAIAGEAAAREMGHVPSSEEAA